jgi:Ca-activated chloride channel family protein
MFRFAAQEYLYLLILVPLLVAVFAAVEQSGRRRIARFGNPATLAALMPDASPKRVRNKFIIWLIALVLIIFALARPQTGSKLKDVEREGIEIMLAVDVSNSMLARDFEPNRLERTKYAVMRVLEGLSEDRVGVVVFAGDAYVQLPITSDFLTARNFVEQISPNIVSKQGTAIGAAISLASGSFTSDSGHSRVIILITDGENHEDDALAAARHAASQGITVYVIGIGTPEGAPIQIGEDFIRDSKGDIVVSKLDEETLQQIALATDGAYIRAGNQSIGLEEIINSINDTEKSKLSAQVFEEYNELFQYVLAAALLLLLVEETMLSRKNRLLAKYNIFNKIDN